jgi:hypothetical protein
MAPKRDDSSIIEKIRKLLALSESANEHEAASAAAKASELLLKHELSAEQVRLATNTEDDEVTTQRFNWICTKQCRRWEAELAFSVSKHNFCTALVSPYRVTFIGRPTDIKVVHFMFEQLAIRLGVMAKKATKQHIADMKTAHDKEQDMLGAVVAEFNWRAVVAEFNWRELRGSDNIRTWRAAWLDGAVDGINQQLYEMRRRAKKDIEGSTALIHLRGAKVDAYMEKKYPKVGTYSPQGVASWDGYDKGRSAGTEMAIHAGLQAGNSGKRIGKDE